MAEGKEHVTVGWVGYLLEHAVRTDVAFVRAHTGDTWGNLRYRGTAGNLSPLCAMCADHVVAEVDFLCDVGEIGADSIHTPGIYVDAVVRSRLDQYYPRTN